MSQEKRIDLLNDAFWGQTAQGASRQTQMRAGIINDHFDVPALMIQHSHLFGWVEEGIKQGGHQSIDLLSGSWNAWIGEGVGDHSHQHALPTVMILVLIDPRQVGPIQQVVTWLLQDMAPQSSQHMPATGSDLKDRCARMKSTIPQDQTLLQPPSFQQQADASGFSLPTRTDFHVTDQMGSAFHQEQ